MFHTPAPVSGGHDADWHIRRQLDVKQMAFRNSVIIHRTDTGHNRTETGSANAKEPFRLPYHPTDDFQRLQPIVAIPSVED